MRGMLFLAGFLAGSVGSYLARYRNEQRLIEGDTLTIELIQDVNGTWVKPNLKEANND